MDEMTFFMKQFLPLVRKHVLRLDKLNNQTTKEGSGRGI